MCVFFIMRSACNEKRQTDFNGTWRVEPSPPVFSCHDMKGFSVWQTSTHMIPRGINHHVLSFLSQNILNVVLSHTGERVAVNRLDTWKTGVGVRPGTEGKTVGLPTPDILTHVPPPASLITGNRDEQSSPHFSDRFFVFRPENPAWPTSSLIVPEKAVRSCRKSLLVSHPRPLIVHHSRGPWKSSVANLFPYSPRKGSAKLPQITPRFSSKAPYCSSQSWSLKIQRGQHLPLQFPKRQCEAAVDHSFFPIQGPTSESWSLKIQRGQPFPL